MTNQIYKLQITLKNLGNKIWRTILVPSDIPLDRLHDLIQIAMGWEDIFPHIFIKNKQEYYDVFDESEADKEEAFVELRDVISLRSKKMKYIYDLESSWEHEIKLLEIFIDDKYEDELDEEDYIFIPTCIDGEGSCPPENMLEVDEFMEILEIMHDTNHEKHKEVLDLYKNTTGDDYFDADDFHPEEVSYLMSKYMKWSRERYSIWF